MAEIVIYQSDGYFNSIATGLFAAAQLKGLGVDVAVVFDEAAIAALAQKKFDNSPPLAKHTGTIMANANKMGMPIDGMDYVKQAKSAGVPLYACGGWSDLLDVRGKLPPEIEVKEIPEVIKLLAEAKKVIGGP